MEKHYMKVIIAVGVCVAVLLVYTAFSLAAGVADGGAVYNQYCAGCHGVNGEGTAHGPDIAGESGDETMDVTRQGEDDMPAFDASVISSAELVSLAEYVRNLAGANPHDGDHHSDDASREQYGNQEQPEDDDSGGGDDSSDDSVEDQYGDDNGGQNGCSASAVANQYCHEDSPRPELYLDARQSSWHSYGDYQTSILTVVYEIRNMGGSHANLIRILPSTSTSSNVQLLTSLPLSVGSVAIGDSDTFKLQYSVPAGTSRYTTIMHATTMTDDGNTHFYPSEVSHSD